jgi:hypothetical protein
MGKSTPKPPKAPDPAATAAAQTAGNKETAYWNAVMGNMNQTTPYGSISYTDSSNGVYDPNKAPQFSSTITLSPEQQQILDSQQANDIAVQNLGTQQIGRIANAVSTPYSYSGLGDAPSQEDIATASQRAEEAIYSRLNPQFQRDEEAMRTRLINQGIGQGSDAYKSEMDSFSQAKNDARMQAILQGANYGGQLQGQALDRRNQGIQEYNAIRNAPLNEYTALTAGQQVQNPSFSAGQRGDAQAGNYQQAAQNAYQGAMNQYNAQVGSNNSTTSGLFGLGGSMLGGAAAKYGLGLGIFSDQRMKENIVPAGQENGYNIYEFNYIGDDKKYTGVMAQEVEKTHPEAIGERDGFKTVNYDMIGVQMREVV